jgi:serine/threonine protein kinase
MPPVQTTDTGTQRPYAKQAGLQPLPGYELLAPLGRGGFGEVWKCVAPGGLHKAVKFVAAAGTGHELKQELAAFEQIKAIRHPFLLSLERVELVNGELVMVMELADGQLEDRFRQCLTAGAPGIPRTELLGYLADAAEALDVIGTKFGLQHLDVKPANLFLTAGRVKVGDYGLVSSLEASRPAVDGQRGLTPKYVAPEVLRGIPSPRSDQYSLALVYQELLTGSFPYAARNPQHMMLQHISAEPDLSGLPACDRVAIGKALAKDPDDRFASCLAFARALLTADPGSLTVPELAVRRARIDRWTADAVDLNRTPAPADPSAQTDRHEAASDPTQRVPVAPSPGPPLTNSGRPLPALVTAAIRRPTPATIPVPPPKPAAPPADEDLPLAAPVADTGVKLNRIKPVVPVSRLTGGEWESGSVSARDFVVRVVTAAAGGGEVPELPGALGRRPDGTLVSRFPSTVAAQMISYKLLTLAPTWGTTIEVEEQASRVVLRRFAPAGLWGSFSRKKSGLEVVVGLPKSGKVAGEVVLTGTTFGNPDENFARWAAADLIPNLMAAVRKELANVEDRRKYPRVPTDLPVTVYPLHGDGRVQPPLEGRCRDVSLGGVCFATNSPVKTRYAFVAFGGVPKVDGLAVLVQLLRSTPESSRCEHVHAGSFRMEL